MLEVELLVEMSIELILQSLLNSFSLFIVNFNMNKIQTSLLELLITLITTEEKIQKEKPYVLFVGGTNKKRKATSACKKGIVKKQVKTTPKRKDSDDKGTNFHDGVKGHWKRNCKKYLNEKAQWKHSNTPCIYMRYTHLSYRDYASCVLDIRCIFYINNDS